MKRSTITVIFFIMLVSICYSQPPAPEGYEWQVVSELSDEFDTWNSSKWWKPLWNYGVPVQMKDENSGVTDGNLWIKATLDDGSERWFETSRVMSQAQISYPMYTECRMRTSHISAYNTFWLNNGDINNRDEIDICENNSNPSITTQVNRPFTMYSQYFITVNGNDERAHGNFDNRNLSEENPLKGVKWNEDYHILGAFWVDKNNVHFYLDGESAGKVSTKRDFTRDLNIIWDLWTINASWSGGIANPDDLLNETNNTMYVDWVHTYKLKEIIVPVENITIPESPDSLQVEESLQLSANISPPNATDHTVNWTSSDPELASVNQNGLVSAIGPGEVDITVTTRDGGFSDKVSFIIYDPIASIDMNPSYSVEAYPNPTKSSLDIIGLPKEPCVVEIRTVSGLLIHTQEFLSIGSKTFDLSKQPPGLYLLNLAWKSGGQTLTVVRQ